MHYNVPLNEFSVTQGMVPAVLANTSLCAEPSEMMAAAASPVGVRSKVKVPEVVNCPDGDTVTVRKKQKCDSCLDNK